LNKTSIPLPIDSEPTNQKSTLDFPKNHISIRKYSEVIQTSKSDCDTKLLDSKRVEQEIRSKMSMATANQTAYLFDLVENRDQQIEPVEQETNESINQIQTFYDALYEISLKEK
jgi:hypothetical protein